MNTFNRLALAGLFAFGGLLTVGCSSDSSSSASAQPSTYTGTFTGSSGGGTIILTIAPPAAAAQSAVMPLGVTTDTVHGVIHITGGGNVGVDGVFTPPSGPLDASGGGYTLTGTLSNGVLSGTFTGPGGTSGSFAAGLGGGTKFCGTFSGSDSGTWNLTLTQYEVCGSYTGGQGTGVLLGYRMERDVTLTFANGSATGTLALDGLTVSGTWMTNGGGQSGTWTGSSTSCD